MRPRWSASSMRLTASPTRPESRSTPSASRKPPTSAPPSASTLSPKRGLSRVSPDGLGAQNSYDPTRPTETAKPLPRRLRRVALAIVKPAPGFAAEPPGFDVFYEERAGAVLAVGEPLIQHLHDREARIEPDEIGQFQRSHRVVGA